MIIGPPMVKTVGACVGSQVKRPGSHCGASVYQGGIQISSSPTPSSV
jgi:hypothetical protein